MSARRSRAYRTVQGYVNASKPPSAHWLCLAERLRGFFNKPAGREYIMAASLYLYNYKPIQLHEYNLIKSLLYLSATAAPYTALWCNRSTARRTPKQL